MVTRVFIICIRW